MPSAESALMLEMQPELAASHFCVPDEVSSAAVLIHKDGKEHLQVLQALFIAYKSHQSLPAGGVDLLFDAVSGRTEIANSGNWASGSVSAAERIAALVDACEPLLLSWLSSPVTPSFIRWIRSAADEGGAMRVLHGRHCRTWSVLRDEDDESLGMGISQSETTASHNNVVAKRLADVCWALFVTVRGLLSLPSATDDAAMEVEEGGPGMSILDSCQLLAACILVVAHNAMLVQAHTQGKTEGIAGAGTTPGSDPVPLVAPAALRRVLTKVLGPGCLGIAKAGLDGPLLHVAAVTQHLLGMALAGGQTGDDCVRGASGDTLGLLLAALGQESGAVETHDAGDCDAAQLARSVALADANSACFNWLRPDSVHANLIALMRSHASSSFGHECGSGPLLLVDGMVMQLGTSYAACTVPREGLVGAGPAPPKSLLSEEWLAWLAISAEEVHVGQEGGTGTVSPSLPPASIFTHVSLGVASTPARAPARLNNKSSDGKSNGPGPSRPPRHMTSPASSSLTGGVGVGPGHALDSPVTRHSIDSLIWLTRAIDRLPGPAMPDALMSLCAACDAMGSGSGTAGSLLQSEIESGLEAVMARAWSPDPVSLAGGAGHRPSSATDSGLGLLAPGVPPSSTRKRPRQADGGLPGDDIPLTTTDGPYRAHLTGLASKLFFRLTGRLLASAWESEGIPMAACMAACSVPQQDAAPLPPSPALAAAVAAAGRVLRSGHTLPLAVLSLDIVLSASSARSWACPALLGATGVHAYKLWQTVSEVMGAVVPGIERGAGGVQSGPDPSDPFAVLSRLELPAPIARHILGLHERLVEEWVWSAKFAPSLAAGEGAAADAACVGRLTQHAASSMERICDVPLPSGGPTLVGSRTEAVAWALASSLLQTGREKGGTAGGLVLMQDRHLDTLLLCCLFAAGKALAAPPGQGDGEGRVAGASNRISFPGLVAAYAARKPAAIVHAVTRAIASPGQAQGKRSTAGIVEFYNATFLPFARPFVGPALASVLGEGDGKGIVGSVGGSQPASQPSSQGVSPLGTPTRVPQPHSSPASYLQATPARSAQGSGSGSLGSMLGSPLRPTGLVHAQVYGQGPGLGLGLASSHVLTFDPASMAGHVHRAPDFPALVSASGRLDPNAAQAYAGSRLPPSSPMRVTMHLVPQAQQAEGRVVGSSPASRRAARAGTGVASDSVAAVCNVASERVCGTEPDATAAVQRPGLSVHVSVASLSGDVEGEEGGEGLSLSKPDDSSAPPGSRAVYTFIRSDPALLASELLGGLGTSAGVRQAVARDVALALARGRASGGGAARAHSQSAMGVLARTMSDILPDACLPPNTLALALINRAVRRATDAGRGCGAENGKVPSRTQPPPQPLPLAITGSGTALPSEDGPAVPANTSGGASGPVARHLLLRVQAAQAQAMGHASVAVQDTAYGRH